MATSGVHVALLSMLKGATALSVNVVLSGVLEALFPPYDSKASPWMNLVEGTVEIALFVLLAGTVDTWLDSLFAGYEYASLPYGALAMFWLLKNALWKINSFVGYISYRLNVRRAQSMHPSSKDLAAFVTREQCEAGDTSCSDAVSAAFASMSDE
jgi:hypothetical protein